MKYAFNTWVYSSYPSWLPAYTLEETIRRIAKFGYDGIEIGCAAPHAYPAHLDAAQRKSIRALLSDVGLTPVSLLPAPGGGQGNNPASPLAAERAATVEHYKEVIDLAADLGADRVLYIPGWLIYGTSREQAYSWTQTALQAIAQYAAEKGIQVLVEPTPFDSDLIETLEEAILLTKDVDSENVGVMLDTSHALYRKESCADIIRQYGEKIVHIHAADVDRLPPGQGILDWLGIMQALSEADFQGYITMEIGFTLRSTDPDAYARSAIRYLKEIEESIK